MRARYVKICLKIRAGERKWRKLRTTTVDMQTAVDVEEQQKRDAVEEQTLKEFKSETASIIECSHQGKACKLKHGICLCEEHQAQFDKIMRRVSERMGL